MRDCVERTVVLPGPAARVWTEITAGLSEWFGATVDLEERPGGRATFRWADGRERGAVVEEYRPPVRFAFRWLPFERRGGETRLVPASRVVFELEELDDGTRLWVTEQAMGEGGPRVAWSAREPAWAR